MPLSYDFGFMDYAAYDYYDWVCDATTDSCQLCDVLTGSCCDPKANDNCFLPDSCANNPCLSGGTCVTTRTRDNYPDFVCVCLRGLTGKYCQLVDDFTPPLVVPVPAAVPAPGRLNPVAAPPLNRPQTPSAQTMGPLGTGPLGGMTGTGLGGLNTASQVMNGMNGMNGLMNGLGMSGMGAMSGMNGGGQQQQNSGGGFFGNRAGAAGFGGQGMNGMGMGGGGMGMGGMGMGGMGAMGGMGGMGGMGAMGGMGGMAGRGGGMMG